MQSYNSKGVRDPNYVMKTVEQRKNLIIDSVRIIRRTSLADVIFYGNARSLKIMCTKWRSESVIR